MSSDELPETFDPGAYKGTDCVLPGWYPAHIIEAAVCDASNGNGTYLLATFEILAGEYKNRKIFQNVTLQNASQQAVEIGAPLERHVRGGWPHRADEVDGHSTLQAGDGPRRHQARQRRRLRRQKLYLQGEGAGLSA